MFPALFRFRIYQTMSQLIEFGLCQPWRRNRMHLPERLWFGFVIRTIRCLTRLPFLWPQRHNFPGYWSGRFRSTSIPMINHSPAS